MSIAHIKTAKPNHRNLPQTRIIVPTLLQSKAIRSLSPARSHLRQERQGDDHFAACLARADCRVVADAVRLDLMGQVRGPRAWDMGRFVALVWGFRKARCFQTHPETWANWDLGSAITGIWMHQTAWIILREMELSLPDDGLTLNMCRYTPPSLILFRPSLTSEDDINDRSPSATCHSPVFWQMSIMPLQVIRFGCTWSSASWWVEYLQPQNCKLGVMYHSMTVNRDT